MLPWKSLQFYVLRNGFSSILNAEFLPDIASTRELRISLPEEIVVELKIERLIK